LMTRGTRFIVYGRKSQTATGWGTIQGWAGAILFGIRVGGHNLPIPIVLPSAVGALARAEARGSARFSIRQGCLSTRRRQCVRRSACSGLC